LILQLVVDPASVAREYGGSSELIAAWAAELAAAQTRFEIAWRPWGLASKQIPYLTILDSPGIGRSVVIAQMERTRVGALCIARLESSGTAMYGLPGEPESMSLAAPLRGGTLSLSKARWLRAVLKESGRLPLEDACTVAQNLVTALVFLHSAKVTDREEIKAFHVQVSADYKALLLDFGHFAAGSAEPSNDVGYGQSGELARLNPQDDFRALGLIFAEMLTGVPQAGDAGDATAAVAVPDAVRRVMERCTSRDPAQGYPNWESLRLDLLDCARPGRASRRGRFRIEDEVR
jgi:hypothetical protein